MGFMDKLSETMEKFLLPIAQKVGTQRHLVALRDGFIATMTASIAGAFAVLFNCVFFNHDDAAIIGKQLYKLGFWKDYVSPILDKYVINMGWQIQNGTLKILAILLVITIAYSLAKSYDTDPFGAAVCAFSSYFILMTTTFDNGSVFTLNEKTQEYVAGVQGVYNMEWLGSNAMFTSILVAFVATELFVRITKKGIVIKMPEQVPPAVSRSFAALIPSMATMLVFGIISTIFINGVGKDLPAWLFKTLQQPLMNLGQSPITFIFLSLLAQLLWFFGLHGMNIVEAILKPLYEPAKLDNIDKFSQGLEPQYALTRNFIDVYAMPGGAGGTIGLLIAIFIFSKREESRELAKLAIAPAIFQINEPVIFGLPIILNVTYFIPFLLGTPLMLTIAWIFTAPIPFAHYICVYVPLTCPPVVSAFFATGGDWKATVLAAALLLFSIVLWIPFVLVANRQKDIEV